MNRHTLIAEIAHSTQMLRLVFSQFASANACDRDWLRVDAVFWHGNRARCRQSLENLS